MFFPKIRHRKQKGEITKEEVRSIIKEELDLADSTRKKMDESEKERMLRKRKFNNLSRSTKLRLLRHLKEKGEQNAQK